MIHYTMGYDAKGGRGKGQPQIYEIHLVTAAEGVVASGTGRDRDSLDLTVTAPAHLAGDYRVEVGALSQGPLCLIAPALRDPDGTGAALLAEGGLWACNDTLGPVAIAGQWLQDGQAIAGQTGAQVDLGPDRAGHVLSYSESAAQTGRNAIALSPEFQVPATVDPQPDTVISTIVAPQQAQTFGGDRIGDIPQIATYRDIANYDATKGATIVSVMVAVNGTAQPDGFVLSAGDAVTLQVTASDGTSRFWDLSTTQAAAVVSPVVLTTRAYPTGFGMIAYDIAPQIPGAAKAVSWTVGGSQAVSIDAAGVLSFNSDSIAAGTLDLTGTAVGADNENWTLTVGFEAIIFAYDGIDTISVDYPADTPRDGTIAYTPSGGVQDGREIAFTPADLDGLADGEGFAALAPIITVATDGGETGTLDAGDTIDLQTPALYLYAGSEPAIAYSAHDDDGLVTADIAFPWTVPADLSGTLTILADDGFGNTIASNGLAIAAPASENLSWYEPLAHADLDYENDRAWIAGTSYPSIAAARTAGAIVVNASGVDTVPFTPAVSYTIAGKGITPAGTVNGYVASVDDGEDGNALDHLALIGQTATGDGANRWSYGAFVGSATINRYTDVMGSSVAFRVAFKIRSGASIASLNGATTGSYTVTSLPAVSRFNARNRADGMRGWGGTVKRVLLINQDIDETTVNGLLA